MDWILFVDAPGAWTYDKYVMISCISSSWYNNELLDSRCVLRMATMY